MGPTGRAAALGTGAALAIALPAAFLAQVLDARRDGGTGDGPVLYVLAAVVLAGMAVGGLVVGRQRPPHPATTAAGAGLGAIAVVLALGVARRLAAGDDVAWGAVPGPIALATTLAAAAGALSSRSAGRKRP